MTDAIARLSQEQLPAKALAYLDALPPAHRDQLATTIVASMEAKDARLEKALARALDVVPAPLRRPVRKLLFS